MHEKVKKWMEERKEEYVRNFGSAEVAVQRLVMDANVDCATDMGETELSQIAREVLAKDLAEESRQPV